MTDFPRIYFVGKFSRETENPHLTFRDPYDIVLKTRLILSEGENPMADYILSCCSTADLTNEHFAARDIHYICFSFLLDGVQYPDDLGRSMPFDQFYAAMANGSDTKTSQVNVEDYIAYFKGFLEDGKDVLHIAFSSGLSGSCNSARIAADELREQYPQRKILIVDSLAASSGYGLLMDKLADLRDAGMSMEDLADWTENNKLHLHHWFFSTDLTFFVKGGRVSKASGWFGTVLKICPLLNVDLNGKLVPRYKIRGKAKVIEAIVQQMEEHAEMGTDYQGKCFLSHSACEEDAKAVAELVEKTFPKLDGKVQIYSIGTTIGSHTGPGTVALFFWGDERID